MAPGAFRDSIDLDRIKLCWQHDGSQVIGKWLSIEEDDRGLLVRGKLILEVEKAREAYALLRHGAISEMSVGFTVDRNGYTKGENGGVVFNQVTLFEISLVTWAANPAAKVTSVKSIRDFERFLRDAGFSRKQATAIASHGYKVIGQGDPDSDSTPATPEDGEAVEALKALLHTIRGSKNVGNPNCRD
jgi:HK97 family phage prohead protease